MCYLIRSRGKILFMRDGEEPNSPVYEVGVKEFVLFENLPRGIGPHGDGDVEVKEVCSEDEAAQANPVNKRIEVAEPKKRGRPKKEKPQDPILDEDEEAL